MSLAAASFALLVACANVPGTTGDTNDTDQTPQETVGTILLPVLDVSWRLSGGLPPEQLSCDERTDQPFGCPTANERLSIDLSALIPLVPLQAPGRASDGVFHVRIDRSQPAGNLFGDSATVWEEDDTRYIATVSWTSALQSRASCEERLQSDRLWEPVTIRGANGCTTVPGPDIVALEWTENGVFFHYESSTLSLAEAVDWLGTWQALD